MAIDQNCPTLTEIGNKILNDDIKNALSTFVAYGVNVGDAASKVALLALLESEHTTKDDLAPYLLINKKPIAVYYDVDKKLTVRVNFSYEDLIRKNTTIEGIGLLTADDQLALLYKDHAILQGEQAKIEGIIKIHNVVGVPGEVVYYTGSYLTREEYEASKVTMVDTVYNMTQQKLEPMIKQTFDDFKAEGATLIENQKTEHQKALEQLRQDYETIKEQATRDLTGVLDHVSMLQLLSHLEHKYDLFVHQSVNFSVRLYSTLVALIDLLDTIEEEKKSIGNVGLFFRELPHNYIYFNTPYKITDYHYIYSKAKLAQHPFLVTEKDTFTFKWRPKTPEQSYYDRLDGLYIKAQLTSRDTNPLVTYDQQLPKPFTYMEAEEDNRGKGSLKVASWSSQWDVQGGNTGWIAEGGEAVTGEIYGNSGHYEGRIDSKRVNINPTHTHRVRGNLAKPYVDSIEAPVEVQRMNAILGIKAKPDVDIIKSLDRILDTKLFAY